MIGLYGLFISKTKKSIKTEKFRKVKKAGFRKRRKQLRSKRTLLLTAGILTYLVRVFTFLFSFLIKIHLIIGIIVLFVCLYIKDNNPPFSSLMVFRHIANHKNNKKVIFIPLSHIPKSMQYRLVLIEDYKFYEHNGVDVEAIKYAYNVNKRLGYKYSGGSTITQQLARNIFLMPVKNYLRKYLEVLIAVEMDFLISKHRILELYINNIEFGNGIYGIGRASYFYYGKSIYNLTDDEINKLFTIIPSPLKFNPNNFIKNYHLNTRYIRLTSLTSS